MGQLENCRKQAQDGLRALEDAYVRLARTSRPDPEVLALTELAASAARTARKHADEAVELARQREVAARQAELRLQDLIARNRELTTLLRIERGRRQAERVAPVEQATETELALVRTELAAAVADRDLYARLLETAEDERDEAIRVRGRLAAEVLQLRPDPVDPVEMAAAGPVPATFAEVIDAAAHPLLAFTLDREITAQLDRFPPAAGWRRRTVQALETLVAYASAKDEVRRSGQPAGHALADLATFVRAGGPRVALSAAAIALNESAQVTETARFADARIFRVPARVHPAGRLKMHSHIRIGGVYAPAPRLHFHDDTGRTGLVVIGYLGPHLPTNRTN
ncbi:hypothetical protein [Fodinicola acaciae]|uniref:hypothetical protein n=1 Tax=Fodinicola acaciae TaxID=2681555 RepID=UPI0013D5F22D|nr:hypothetical protein [Fodinicola acaciae]